MLFLVFASVSRSDTFQTRTRFGESLENLRPRPPFVALPPFCYPTRVRDSSMPFAFNNAEKHYTEFHGPPPRFTINT